MIDIKINKIGAVCLLMAVFIGFSQTPKIDESNDFSTKQTEPIVTGWGITTVVSIKPDKLNLGDIVEITCLLKSPYRNLPESKAEFKLIRGAKLVSGKTSQAHKPLKKNETANFSIKVEVISRLLLIEVGIFVHTPSRFNLGKEWLGVGGGTVDMIALAKDDTISYEKFGNDPDLWSRIGPEYQYDFVEGVRIPPLGHVSKEIQEIRNEMEELKKIDSTLSDWDALEMLHDILEPMVVRYGIHKKEESIPILLKARKLMREKGLSKWEAVDKVVDEMKNEKGRINFFRPDRSSDNDCYSTDSYHYFQDKKIWTAYASFIIT